MKKKFSHWLIPILINFIVIFLFIAGMLLKRDSIVDLSIWIFFLNIPFTIISSIIQIVNRKWYYTFPQIGFLFVLFFILGFIFILSPPDFYGVHKKIPEGISISEPLTSKPPQQLFNASHLIVSCIDQPGIYTYYTDYIPQEDGYFYIKAFEINSNDELSKDDIMDKSKVFSEKMNPHIKEGTFRIYEGSWGDKYASRMELWFHPLSKKPAFKIEERNYIIEGWQR